MNVGIEDFISQFAFQMGADVRVVDGKCSRDGTSDVAAVNGYVAVFIVVEAKLRNGSVDGDVGLLTVVQLSADGYLGGKTAKLAVGQQLAQTDALGRDVPAEFLSGIHVEPHVDVAGTRADQRFEGRHAVRIAVAETVDLQTAQTGELGGQLREGLGEEVETGLSQTESVNLNVPGRLFVPVAQPPV